MLVVLTTLTAAGTRPGQWHPANAAATCRATGSTCTAAYPTGPESPVRSARSPKPRAARPETGPATGATTNPPTENTRAPTTPKSPPGALGVPTGARAPQWGERDASRRVRTETSPTGTWVTRPARGARPIELGGCGHGASRTSWSPGHALQTRHGRRLIRAATGYAATGYAATGSATRHTRPTATGARGRTTNRGLLRRPQRRVGKLRIGPHRDPALVDRRRVRAVHDPHRLHPRLLLRPVLRDRIDERTGSASHGKAAQGLSPVVRLRLGYRRLRVIRGGA